MVTQPPNLGCSLATGSVTWGRRFVQFGHRGQQGRGTRLAYI